MCLFVKIGLPLKTASHPVGTYFETQLQEKLTSIYDYIFVEGTPFVNDSAYKITRRELARRDAAELADEVKRHLGGIGGGKVCVLCGLPHLCKMRRI